MENFKELKEWLEIGNLVLGIVLGIIGTNVYHKIKIKIVNNQKNNHNQENKVNGLFFGNKNINQSNKKD